MPEIKIPFPGLYESGLSQSLDYAEEREIENRAEHERGEYDPAEWPEPLLLTEKEIGDAWHYAMDYDTAHEHIARDYLTMFDEWAGEALGETRPAWRHDYDWQTKETRRIRYAANSCGFKWSIMTSPRFYNFETDRLFATCSMAFVKRLWTRSKADNHATLKTLIYDTFTSYDGFISHYPNRLDDWPTDLHEWDHNQLGTLLLVCLNLADADDHDFQMQMLEHGDFDAAVAAGIDDADLDARLMEKRIEKLVEWAAADPLAVAAWAAQHPEQWEKLRATDEAEVLALDLPMGDDCGQFYRCPETPDMFATA